MSRRRTMLAVVLAMAMPGILAGCADDGASDASTTTAAARSDGSMASEELPDARKDPASSSSSGGTGGCDGYDDEDPDDDVILANCNGTATISVSVDGDLHTIQGGTCERFGDSFNVNAGVLLTPTLDDRVEPDHVALSLPLADGEHDVGDDEVIFTVAVGGLAYSADGGNVSHDAESVAFEVTDDIDGVAIVGRVDC